MQLTFQKMLSEEMNFNIILQLEYYIGKLIIVLYVLSSISIKTIMKFITGTN